MKGWTEEEIQNRELMAPCGLYCGTCGIYIANRDNNEKFKTVMGNLYGLKPDQMACCGCIQPDPPRKIHDFCKVCAIRDCVKSKGYHSCHQCDGWPCHLIDTFPISTGRRVMKRTIPIWREKAAQLGNEQGSVAWARSECERYHCATCGEPLFRGAQKCRACKKPVADELDGTFALSPGQMNP